MDKVRVGVVGCGVIAERSYIPAILKMEKAELVAVCDMVEERVKEYGERFGVPQVYTDYDKMLQSDIDLVVDLTPIPIHYNINLQALQAGKHVYSEKPMTLTVEEATTLIEEAKKRSLRIGAAAATMLSPVNKKIASILKAGTIGKVCYAISRNSHGGPAAAFNWTTDPTWFYKPGAGPIYDMGVYGLHTLTGLLGPAKALTCMSGISWTPRTVRSGPAKGKRIDVEIDDATLITLDFGKATFGFSDASFCVHHTKGPSLQIFGSDGVIAVNERGASAPISVFPYVPEAGPGETQWEDVHPDDSRRWGLPMGVEHLIDCILDPSMQVVTSAEHARHVIEIMSNCYPAAREGRTVQLETIFP